MLTSKQEPRDAEAVGPSQTSGASTWACEPITDRTQRVAAVAAAHASAVDAEARFPSEAIAAAKAEGLMGVMAPAAMGGEDASPSVVADICYTLGQACASTGLIFAMHQVKVACVVGHFQSGGWHEGFLRRLVDDQWLVASSTTEGQAGGDVRSSAAAVAPKDGRITLDRDASVISYGAQADALVTTARRSAEADASDQVLLVLEKADYSLSQTQTWDTLGMRGTCSTGFALKADADRAQILPTPYALIHPQSMVPCAHLFWSSVWAGIAASSVERARRFIRKAARNAGGQLPPAAAYLGKANTSMRALRALIATMLVRYEAIQGDAEALGAIEFQAAINLLKVDVSELAVATVMSALRACGLSGYRNDSEATLGRHLRDVLSAPIMINNDRILANLAASSLVAETPRSLSLRRP
jgi:acyl-CoA dehydrogenase